MPGDLDPTLSNLLTETDDEEQEYAPRISVQFLVQEREAIHLLAELWGAFDHGRGKRKKWTDNRAIRRLVREAAADYLRKLGGPPHDAEERAKLLENAKKLGERVRDEQSRRRGRKPKG